MSSLSITSLTKTYPDGTRAVDELSLEINDGEFLVLVGPSGCGKSTSLRMIAGLEQITSGEIRIGERVVNNVPPKDRNISMVFQNYALYPHMTVRKNLSFGLELRYGGGWLERSARRILQPSKAQQLHAKRATIDDRVEHAAELLKISHLLRRMPAQLSGGERQRVALGRAIVREPEVFLFDEPLSNLDAKLRVEMRRELKQLHARLGTTMIYVTHDQVEAMTLGDRVAVMNEGQLQQVGPPLELYDQPANRFVASFLGSPAMNLLDGTVIADDKLRLKCVVGRSGTSSRPARRSGTPSRPVRRSGTPSVPSTDSPSTRNSSPTIASDDGRSTTSSYDLTIDLPELWRTKLAPHHGNQVTIGIRPEHVQLADSAPNSHADAIVLNAKASLVESLGDTTLATFELIDGEASAIQLVAKLDRYHRLTTGDRRKLIIDAERLHLFTDDSPTSS